MQKQKLFKVFSCINSSTPDLFETNRVVFLGADGKGAEAPRQLLEKAEKGEPDNPERAGADAIKKGTDTISPFEAARKVAESVVYLQKQNKDKAITQERLIDALKSGGYLSSADNPPSSVDIMKAIKTMQGDLGFKGEGVDGEIGKNTYEKMIKEKPDMNATLMGTFKQEKLETVERPELPADAKTKIELKLSQVSDALQVNYKTAARLHDNLFNTDGTFKQSPNADDLMAYKTELDNIDGQLKSVDGIGSELKGYKVPADFTLTITNKSGDTRTPRIVHCSLHNEFVLSKSALFSADGEDGRVFLHHYKYMQNNFEKRLAELKTDYDRIVNEWAENVAGPTGRTGDDAMWQNLQKISDSERTPPVLTLLGIKTDQFNADVYDKAGTILAERNAKEDKEMAEAKTSKLSQQVVSAKTALDEAKKIATEAKSTADKADRIRIAAEKRAAEAETNPVARADKENLARAAALRAIDLNAKYAGAEKYAKAAEVVYAKASETARLAGVDVEKLIAPNPAAGAAAATDKEKGKK